jgi:hypothetical protein
MPRRQRIEVKFTRPVFTLEGLERHYRRCHLADCKPCALRGIVNAHAMMTRAVRRATDVGATQRDVALVFAELLALE